MGRALRLVTSYVLFNHMEITSYSKKGKKMWYNLSPTQINNIWRLPRNYQLFHGIHVKARILYILVNQSLHYKEKFFD